MDWIVRISDWERNLSALEPATVQTAQSALREHGCVLFRNAFLPSAIDSVRAAFERQWGNHNQLEMDAISKRAGPNPVLCVGEKRYEVLPNVVGALADPMLFANPLLSGFLASVLGHGMKVSGITVVVSFPG